MVDSRPFQLGHHMAKDDVAFAQRIMLALQTAVADRAELDRQIAVLLETLGKTFGVKIAEETAIV